MKKQQSILLVAALTAASAFASDESKKYQIVFSDLPFAEGKIYLAATCAGERIFATISDVEEDIVTIPLDFSDYEGKEIVIQAFQDMNGNKQLDLDTYGRPLEPCIQTSVTLSKETPVITLQLIQY